MFGQVGYYFTYMLAVITLHVICGKAISLIWNFSNVASYFFQPINRDLFERVMECFILWNAKYVKLAAVLHLTRLCGRPYIPRSTLTFNTQS